MAGLVLKSTAVLRFLALHQATNIDNIFMNDSLEKIVTRNFSSLVTETRSKIEKETIQTILGNRTPLTVNLFSDNISDYLYFLVCQRVTTSFSTRLGKVIEKLCEDLVTYRGGQIIQNPKPYDLKFILNNTEEYWIEIKSIGGQNSSNKQTILERKMSAEDQGKNFRLCMYNDDKEFKDDYILNGKQFWNFILGENDSLDKIFKLLKGKGIDLSFQTIIEENFNRLKSEYEEKHCY
mgnify:CR=1 FL=1